MVSQQNRFMFCVCADLKLEDFQSLIYLPLFEYFILTFRKRQPSN